MRHSALSQTLHCALAAFGTFVFGAAHAADEAIPKPPQQICINQVCTDEGAPPATGTLKWHPGHYMRIIARHRDPAKELPYIEAIGDEPAVAGVQVTWLWRNIEKSPGVYDFSSIDTYLNKVKSLPRPKKIIIRITERGFSSTTTTSVPDYLKSDPIYNGGEVIMGNGVVARIWEAPVMDRLILLYKALGARYDADPYVEGTSTSETAITFSSTYPAPSSYTQTAVLTQFKRLLTGIRQYWPRSQIFLSTNYLGTDAQMEDLIKHSQKTFTAVGGPDVWSRAWVESGKRALQSDLVVRGERGSGTDYRGVIAIKAEVQAPELGGYIAEFTAEELYDTAYNINRANYIFWDRNDYVGGPLSRWDTGILPLIRKVNGKTVTTCPSSFQGRCSTQ